MINGIRSNGAPYLSFVIPAYNEEKNIRPLHQSIKKACAAIGSNDYEIVIVENGSFDRTAEEILDLARSDNRIKMVQLSRNFGYQGGISAGLAQSRGKWVALLDADQQDPPEVVVQMLKMAEAEHLDVVYGIRAGRKETTFKKIMFWTFYRMWKLSANIQVPVDAGEFCVMNREVVNVIVRLPEKQRFTRGLRAWVGFKQAGFPYYRSGRGEGRTKFNILSAINLALDGILAYTILPIRLITIVGLLLMVPVSLLLGLNIIAVLLDALGFKNIIFRLPPGLTQLTALNILFFGFSLFSMGTIGEYVGRIYEEVKDRPSYIVKRIVDFQNTP